MLINTVCSKIHTLQNGNKQPVGANKLHERANILRCRLTNRTDMQTCFADGQQTARTRKHTQRTDNKPHVRANKLHGHENIPCGRTTYRTDVYTYPANRQQTSRKTKQLHVCANIHGVRQANSVQLTSCYRGCPSRRVLKRYLKTGFIINH